MANNSVSLPHDFSTLGKETTIATGVYYHLIPVTSSASVHLGSVPQTGFWFPVTGDSPIDFTFNHTWDMADNLAKKQLDSVGQNSDFVNLGVKQVQHYFGGSLYLSGCAVYNTSASPTINVVTKLFSVGGNNLIQIVEALRGDTHARITKGGNVGAGVKGGLIQHPGWWKIQVVSFADGATNIVSDMNDMICIGLKVTMYSPWLGVEPCYMELAVSFQHGYPGLTESMKFGGSL